jgi:hypothetical protein
MTSENETRIRFIKDAEKQTPHIVEMFFNSSWLDAKAENDPEGRTNREVQIMVRAQLNGVDRRADDALQAI